MSLPLKILLFGKNGQIGWELQRSLAPLGQVCALGLDSTDLCGDLNNLPGLTETVLEVKPDIIVNAAAYTAVDKAESEPELARAINALAPGALAQAAQRTGAWLVHYSTDYVFDGSGNQPWKETDTPSPLSVYGKTKLEGDQLIAARCAKHLIFRTSWVYAARGDNFAKSILKLAMEGDQLTVINDQVGAPTGADLVADVTAHVLRHVLSDRLANRQGYSGLYHLAAQGETSWHGYAQFVVAHARRSGAALKTDVANIEPVTASAFPMPARRPCNSRLDTGKLRATFGVTLPAWQQGVERMLTEIL